MAKSNTCIRLTDETLNWLDSMVKKKIFANRTHGIEYALSYLKSVYDREGRLPPIE